MVSMRPAMSQLDLRLLRYFVAVAETEHVGRAASRLGMSQSPLSRQLRELESRLGVPLFVRESRRIRLSEAGERLLPEATKLLKDAVRLMRWAERLARGETGRLSIGFVRNAFWSGVLPLALSSFRTQHPQVEIELHNCTSRVQCHMLLRREIDVGLAHWPAANRQVQSECVIRQAFRLAVPGKHPLLARTEIRAADLDGVPWIVLERKHDPTAHDRLLAACARAGLRPNIEYETSDLPMALSYVAAGLGVALAQDGVPNPYPGLVEMRRVPWLALESQLFMLRRRESPTPQVRDLARMLRSGITRRLRSAAA
jgi:DNA-binding transcriptional LysR family regulator